MKILLTGASGGIGRALAARLGAAGARVTLFGRREGALRAAARPGVGSNPRPAGATLV